jgi:CRP/FNR family transcriptional regulator
VARAKIATACRGPTIRASDPWTLSGGRHRQLLSEEERAHFSAIASIVRFKKGAEIYREGQSANAVFNIISGVVKAFRTTSDGSEHITEFLFPDDLFELPEEGKYVNSTLAITAVTAFQIPCLLRAFRKTQPWSFMSSVSSARNWSKHRSIRCSWRAGGHLKSGHVPSTT